MKELEKSELMEVDGGVFWSAVGLAIFACLLSDWDNFERGLCGKPYNAN